jgi:CheY-like chemotaxis protein
MANRIMIVEDEALVAEMIAFSLEDGGYEVAAICDSVAGAIIEAERLRPDLALMDINLGRGGDGVEAAAAIGSRYAVPVLFITAQTDAETRSRAVATGPVGFLPKPFTASGLLDAVSSALARGV